MNILDTKIHVEINTHGGISLHIPETPKRAAFCIWNAVGGKWGVTYSPPPGKQGKWVMARYYNSPLDAIWAELGFGEDIFHDEVVALGLIDSAAKDGKNVGSV